MEVRRIGVLNNYRVFEFTGELTNSAATKDFLSLNESLSSYAAIDNKLAPMMIEWKLRDGKQVTRGSVAPPRAGSFDLVSLFYSIRTLSMTPNSIQQLSFFDADKQVMSISIKTVKTEVINTKLGNRDTIQLDIYSVGQTPVLLAQAWLANDNSRIPLYFVTRTSFGELRFQISKIF